jgi:hypothetical protein
VLIILIGAYLLWTSLTHRHDASPKGRSLALATGMIPCPLTTFVLSYALARGVLASGLLVAAAMTVGMIATIGGVALMAAFARDRLVALLGRTEGWRHSAGMVLEAGGAVLVLLDLVSVDASIKRALCARYTHPPINGALVPRRSNGRCRRHRPSTAMRRFRASNERRSRKKSYGRNAPYVHSFGQKPIAQACQIVG